MSVIVRQVAKQLKKLRHDREMSLQEVAKRARMKFPNIHKIENGVREPRVSTFLKLLKAMDSDLVDFSRRLTPKKRRPRRPDKS
jgi:transcriptional regulator with XRE-family HTH domain